MYIEDMLFVLNNKKWYKCKWIEWFNEKEEKKYY